MWDVHWYGYFRSLVTPITMTCNGKEGTTGAGGEPLKFFGTTSSHSKELSFLIYKRSEVKFF